MKAIIKRLKSKTYWTAIFGTVLVVLDQNAQIISSYLPANMQGLTVLMWPVLMVALREITKTPVSEK